MDRKAMRYEGVDWIYVVRSRDKWRTVVNAVMNIRVQLNSGVFLTSWAVSFSKKGLCSMDWGRLQCLAADTRYMFILIKSLYKWLAADLLIGKASRKTSSNTVSETPLSPLYAQPIRAQQCTNQTLYQQQDSLSFLVDTFIATCEMRVQKLHYLVCSLYSGHVWSYC